MKYNGDIKDFPTEIVEKMLERQFEQGNPKDITVFEKNSWKNKAGGGFDWEKTPEEFNFWLIVIFFNKFNIFFAKYPKQQDCSIISQFNAQNKCKN